MATSIANKLETLKKTKTSIKEAIIAKGISVSDTDSFSSYADKIKQIKDGANVQDEKEVDLNGTELEVVPDDGYDSMKKVSINAKLGTKEITPSTDKDITIVASAEDLLGYSSIVIKKVDARGGTSGSTISTETKDWFGVNGIELWGGSVYGNNNSNVLVEYDIGNKTIHSYTMSGLISDTNASKYFQILSWKNNVKRSSNVNQAIAKQDLYIIKISINGFSKSKSSLETYTAGDYIHLGTYNYSGSTYTFSEFGDPDTVYLFCSASDIDTVLDKLKGLNTICYGTIGAKSLITRGTDDIKLISSSFVEHIESSKYDDGKGATKYVYDKYRINSISASPIDYILYTAMETPVPLIGTVGVGGILTNDLAVVGSNNYYDENGDYKYNNYPPFPFLIAKAASVS